jgi:hypothetical protein
MTTSLKLSAHGAPTAGTCRLFLDVTGATTRSGS